MPRSKIYLAFVVASGLSACDAPVSETVAGASPPNAVWILQSINEQTVSARTTLQFQPNGGITGDGPCNSYSASQKIPLPWFEAGPIMSTKRACENLSEEQKYFSALDDVIFAEITGNTMLLTGDNGVALLYRIE